jgi:hypothetical protein
MMPRHFRAREGRTITLPQGLAAGPGATNMRLTPGEVVTVDDDAATRHSRFINGRLIAGDLEEMEAALVGHEEHARKERTYVPRHDAPPSKPFGLPGSPDVPTKKER